MSYAGAFITGGVIAPLYTLTGDTGGKITADGTFNMGLVGSGPISIDGNSLTHTLTVNIEDPLTVSHGGTGRQTLTDHGVLLGAGIAAIRASNAGADGQVLIGDSGGDPQFVYISSVGGTIDFTYGPNYLNLEVDHAVSHVHGDSGIATPVAGSLTIAGGTNLTTVGAAATLTVNLDASISGMTAVDFGTSGRIGTGLVAGDALLLRAYDADGATYVTFATLTANNTPTMDLDDAVTKAGNYIYRAGGTDVPVTDGGTGVSTLTDHGVLVGSGASAIDAITAGSDGQVLIGSTGSDPIFGSISSIAGTIGFTAGAGTLAMDVNTSFRTASGWASWGGAGNYFDDTTIGDFTILRPGTGYINGALVSWLGSQTISGLTAGNTYYIYIDSTGTIGKTTSSSTTLFENNIVLFECMRDSTPVTNNQITVKENHTYKFQPYVSYYAHQVIGCVIENNSNGANITINGTQKIQINGADELSDHGLYTTIPDSGGVAVTFNKYYTDGSGKWALYSSTDTFAGTYNSAGTPTALGASKFGVYTLYVSKDNLTTSTPVYFAVLNTAQYNNLTAANTAISNGTPAKATNELARLEISQLGYIVFSQSTTSIVNVVISKSTLKQTLSTGGTNTAALVNTLTTNFDGILSTSNTNVQSALETIDDWGKTTTDHGVLIGRGTGSAINSTAAGSNGQVLVGSTNNDPVFFTLTSTGGTVIYTPGAGTLNLEATTVGGMTGIDGDSGSATPTLGVIKVSGGTNLTSSATASTVTVNLDASISAMAAVDFANGGRIGTGTTAADTLLLRAYDVNGTAYATFATLTAADTPTMDLDDAVTKAGNYIYRGGGTDVSVADGGTGASTLTDHGVLIGSGTGAVTPLTVGADGYVLIGATGADPVFAALASAGSTIAFTPGAGTLNLETGSAVATSFSGDSGSATPSSGVLTIAGGTNLTSSGASSTMTINLDTAITAMASVDFATGGRLGTGLSAGNTLLLRAYDVDGTAYITFATLTANNTPTMDLDDAVTKASGYIYRGGGTDVPVTDGGTGASTLTDHGVLVGSGTSAVDALTAGSNGQVLVGSTGADPVFATLGSTGGTVSYTTGAGTLNLEVTSPAMAWTEVTGTSQAAAVNNGYITNNVGLVTVTLPATAAVGKIISITGQGAGGWKLAQNASQYVNFESSTTTVGTGGYLASTVRYDCIDVQCTVTNNGWVARSAVGNITVV